MAPIQVSPARFIFDSPENPPTSQFRIEWDDNLQEVRFIFARNEMVNLRHYEELGIIQILREIPADQNTSANILSLPIHSRQEINDFCSKLTAFAVALALNASITVDHNE